MLVLLVLLTRMLRTMLLLPMLPRTMLLLLRTMLLLPCAFGVPPRAVEVGRDGVVGLQEPV